MGLRDEAQHAGHVYVDGRLLHWSDGRPVSAAEHETSGRLAAETQALRNAQRQAEQLQNRIDALRRELAETKIETRRLARLVVALGHEHRAARAAAKALPPPPARLPEAVTA